MAHSSTSNELPSSQPIPAPVPPAARPGAAPARSNAVGAETRWRGVEPTRVRSASIAPASADVGMRQNALPPGADGLHEDEDGSLEEITQSMPAWLVSLMVHLIILLLLALLTYPAQLTEGPLTIELGNAEEGEEFALDEFSVEAPLSTELVQSEATLESEPIVDIDAVESVEIQPLVLSNDAILPPTFTLSSALSGRSGSRKQALLEAFGGTAATQEAVKLGLEWLKRNQQRNGSWSLRGPYNDGAGTENSPAATAMALLAFQGDGNTHQSGPYQKQVENGIKWLVKQQNRDGSFVSRGNLGHSRLYTQAQCMIAVCELYGMTKDSLLREPAQQAVNFAADIQSREGGWRYELRRDADTSVTGWFLMGLKSAEMAGLQVPPATLGRIEYYLETVSSFEGSQYAYQPRVQPSAAMTAEGLLCRQYLGWQADTPAMVEGINLLSQNHPFRFEDGNFYYWYYATQIMHHVGGQPWQQWNMNMRTQLPAGQVKTGKEAGSWAPQRSLWGAAGGRLYTTCLSIYCLEVYYRHMPLYKHSRSASQKPEAKEPDSN